jgi:hypothetical protein
MWALFDREVSLSLEFATWRIVFLLLLPLVLPFPLYLLLSLSLPNMFR